VAAPDRGPTVVSGPVPAGAMAGRQAPVFAEPIRAGAASRGSA
jgi:hypothetical protein